MEPPINQITELVELFNRKELKKAERLANSITKGYPNHCFSLKILAAINLKKNNTKEAIRLNQLVVKLSPDDAESLYNLGISYSRIGELNNSKLAFKKAIKINPEFIEAFNNLGLILNQLGEINEAENIFRKAISINPNHIESLNNLGNVLKDLGKLEESENILQKAILINPNFAQAHNNLGNTLKDLGEIDQAKKSYLKATQINTKYAEAFWNLSSLEKNIDASEFYIKKCLSFDKNHFKARMMKIALDFYKNDKEEFNKLLLSDLKDHPYVRSFNWVFKLQKLPLLFFNRWFFFDEMINLCDTSRPFYEFGVWRGQAFKYIVKSIKFGYGFDTFTGLPEDWKIGNKVENAGSYSTDGVVPSIHGGEFVVGKFEDTLPKFFLDERPIASLIILDADLYSSTICALRNIKDIFDDQTIFIFDEMIMSENWENDEFKALNEFVEDFNYQYEVLAVSFFSKQVAVRIIKN